jgi:hypothetical protein
VAGEYRQPLLSAEAACEIIDVQILEENQRVTLYQANDVHMRHDPDQIEMTGKVGKDVETAQAAQSSAESSRMRQSRICPPSSKRKQARQCS